MCVVIVNAAVQVSLVGNIIAILDCQAANMQKEGLCIRDELESGKDVELTNTVLVGTALRDRIVRPTNLI
jgi:hypothetical protein